jgi:PAS domain S-box-containing protein
MGRTVSREKRREAALLQLAKMDPRDLGFALRTITEVTARTLVVGRVSVWMFEADRRAIRCADLFRLREWTHEEGARIEAARFPTYFQALEESHTIAAMSAQTDPRTREFARTYLRPLGITSMMDVPVRLRGQVVGVVCCEHTGRAKRRWSREDKEFAAAVAGAVSLSVDVAQRVRTEEELSQTASLLRAALESTADGILVVDRQGHTVTLNRKFVEMWRIPHEVVQTRDDDAALASVLPQLSEPERFLKRVREIYADPEIETFDVIGFKDGRLFERYSQPQRIDGESVGRVWSFRDVTERTRAEAERDALLIQEKSAREAAEEALRVRDEFLSIASHELRTPCTALRLGVGNLVRATRPEVPDSPRANAMARALATLDRQTKHLEQLVTQLLDVSRITAGQLRVERELVDLVELVRHCVEALRAEAGRAGCELRLSANGPSAGTWDALRIEQVVSNLLSNAIKYGAGKPIDVEIGGGAEAARIAVRDRGIGIARERQEDIFLRFERAVSARHYGGLGLGLYIVRRILDGMGGSIRVESAVGEGATFIVELPRAMPATRVAV